MGWLIVVVIVIAIAIAGWVLWKRSHQPAPPPPPEPPKPSRVVDATPMTGLEVALDQVTDRSGRNMREKIEGSTPIDDLRVPDDTGPILRRALDNVEQPQPGVPEPGVTAPGAPEPGAPEPGTPAEPVAAPAETAEGNAAPGEG